MNDRDLLEQAANAAGHKWKWTTCPKYEGEVPGMHHRDSINNVDYWFGWNPLEDDGDALGLVVKLGLMVDTSCQPVLIQCAGPRGIGIEEPARAGAQAATRRAIVRAAAAVTSDATPINPQASTVDREAGSSSNEQHAQE